MGDLCLDTWNGKLWQNGMLVGNHIIKYCTQILKKTTWEINGNSYYMLDTNNILYKIGINGALQFKLLLNWLANDYVSNMSSLAHGKLLFTLFDKLAIFDEQSEQLKEYLYKKISFEQLLFMIAIYKTLSLGDEYFYLIHKTNHTWGRVFQSFTINVPELAPKIQRLLSLIKSPHNPKKSFIRLKKLS